MVKIHIGPKGPSKCSARKGNCPFSGEEQHFNSLDEAMKAFERLNNEEFFKPLDNHLKFKCYHCGNFLEKEDESLIENGEDFKCRNCNRSLDIDVVIVNPNKNSSTYPVFIDRKNVYKTVWYHSTEDSDWEQKLELGEGFYAHVGSYESALQRQNQESKKDYWLYELEVDPSASLEEELSIDDNSDYYGFFGDISPDGKNSLSYDVSCYVNKYEDSGSISLIINSKKNHCQKQKVCF